MYVRMYIHCGYVPHLQLYRSSITYINSSLYTVCCIDNLGYANTYINSSLFTVCCIDNLGYTNTYINSSLYTVCCIDNLGYTNTYINSSLYTVCCIDNLGYTDIISFCGLWFLSLFTSQICIYIFFHMLQYGWMITSDHYR